MRRLTIAIAAALLGTGCFVGTDDPCDRTLSMTWDFTDADNVFHTTCQSAGVNFVDVYVSGAQGVRFSCVGATGGTIALPRGTHLVTIEGVSAASVGEPGTIFYRDEIEVTSGCGDLPVSAHLAEQYVQVFYTFPEPNECSSPAAYLWFSIFDEIAQQVITNVTSASAIENKRRYACAADNLIVPLPAGTYQLEWIQEMVEAPAGVFTTAHAQCDPVPFSVLGEYFGEGPVGVNVALTSAPGVSCTP